MFQFIIMKILGPMVICVIFATGAVISGPTSDDCDWMGSGTSEMALLRGVRPVYLRCNQGTVRWNYPQGALRIVLQHRSTGKEFTACVKRSNDTSGARIYLAGRKRLHRVFSAEDPLGLVKCVMSQRGQVALYVEADPTTDALLRATSEFSYYLKKRMGRSNKNVVDDCQPCSEEQLLRQYCTSDFVIQGSVSSLFHNKPLQTTELTVKVSHIHRTNELGRFSSSSDSSTHLKRNSNHIVLHRPLHCGTKAGNGEFLFFGNWVLGYPNLYCVPRLVEWKKVRRKALRTGMNECLL